MTKTILITGGAGFIGSHTVEHIHRKTDWNIVIIDKLTYASKGLNRLRESGLLTSSRVKMFTYDLCCSISDGLASEIGNIDYILHMAAETHVDNSIKTPAFCIHNNITSTVNILEYARTLNNLQKFFYFSTDEVFGSAPGDTAYKENDRHNPTNPYSASKSAAEVICVSYRNTYKIPIIILNVMNAFGERQHVEKFIPKCIKYILEGKNIFIHTDENNNPGSRFYIHSRNIASALLFLIEKGVVGESYNIKGEKEVDNLSMARKIADILGKELKYTLASNTEERPGHDLRYSLNGSKLEQMGWVIPVSFEESLKKTILWTLEHQEWLS
jgi:dTDP-glucose 4,6-dehydratase